MPYKLLLKSPFGISGNTRTSTSVVFVKLEEKGEAGFGEASLPPYLKESQQSVTQFLRKIDTSKFAISNLEEFLNYLHDLQPGNNAAKAAVEIALLDLAGKVLNQPAFNILNLKSDLPLNTYTIGIGPILELTEKLTDAAEFEVIKVKLGSDDDKKIITSIRALTQKPIAVDANQGWKEKSHALEMISWLSDQNVTLIEQPLPKYMKEEQGWLKKHSPLPLYADESFQTLKDLEECAELFHGINIKLMKCGGPWKGLEILKEAKARGLKILVGSMNESSCANLAAAQISAEADLTDLDGPFLISNNPFQRPEMEAGRIVLKDLPGLGLEFQSSITNFPKSFFN